MQPSNTIELLGRCSTEIEHLLLDAHRELRVGVAEQVRARRAGRVGSSHAGRASIERLEGTWENLRLIHLPYHAS